MEPVAYALKWNRPPRWLAYSLCTIVLWGAWGFITKLVSETLDSSTNQVLFTAGLIPLMFIMGRSPRLRLGDARGVGMSWAFLTGVLGSLGNIAFFLALAKGGTISIVGPATALFPLITVVLAVTCLHERLSRQQIFGFGLALVSIYLLL